MQFGEDDSRCELEIPQHFGNRFSLEAVSLALDVSHVDFHVTLHINMKGFLAATTDCYEPTELRRIIYLKRDQDSITQTYHIECIYPQLFSSSYNPTLYSFKLPLNQTGIYRFCAKQKIEILRPTILTVITMAFALYVTAVCIHVAVTPEYRFKSPVKRESPRFKEVYELSRHETMILHANEYQKFHNQSLLTVADTVSYHAIGTSGSWQEILYTFNTKPHRVCVALVTSNYLQEMTKLLSEIDCDDETCDQVISLHLSQRTVPILVGDINMGDFPDFLRPVYFKLNLQRLPKYPADSTTLQNLLQQINERYLFISSLPPLK